MRIVGPGVLRVVRVIRVIRVVRVVRVVRVLALAIAATTTMLAGSLVWPGPTPAGAQEATAEVILAGQTPWVAPDGPFELQLRFRGVDDPAAVDLTVTVHERVKDRSTFLRTVEGELLGDTLTSSRSIPLVDLVPDLDGVVTVPLLPDELPTRAEGGPYPVHVELRGPDGVLDELVTHLIRLPTDVGQARPLAVAWAQPLGLPPALRPDGTVDIDDEAAAQLARVVDALASAPVPLTVVPNPETFESLSAEGKRAVPTLSASLVGRQVAPAPYVEIDIGALAASELGGDVAAQVERGSTVLADVVGVRPETRVWTSNEPLGPDALGLLRFLGVERVVVPEESLDATDLEALGLRTTLTTTFTLAEGTGGGSLQAAQADTALSSHFVTGRDQVLAAHQLLADLAVLYFDQPTINQRGVVVQPPPGWEPSTPFLRAALAGLATGPIVEAVTLDQLFDRARPLEDLDGTIVRRLSEETLEAFPPQVEGVADLRADVASLAGMIGLTNPTLDLLERLILVSQGEDLGDGGQQAYREGVDAGVEEGLGSVQLLDRGGYRLTAQEGTIPLTLVKSVPYPVTVRLVVSNDKLEFLGGSPDQPGYYEQQLTLEREDTPISLRVRARTTGAFTLEIAVTTPDGALEATREGVPVRATAPSWVGVALSVGAGAFLLLWWGRHWRTARRDRRLVRTPG